LEETFRVTKSCTQHWALCASIDPLMTNSLIILCLFITSFLFGQSPTENLSFKSTDLTTVASLSWADISDGFYIGNGFGGLSFHLDPNNKFKKISSDCMSRFTIDSGVWTIKKNILTLKSKTKTLEFSVFKFDNFNFYILPEQRQKFIHDLQASWEECKNFKGIQIGDRIRTAKDMVGYSLISIYYGRDLADSAGT